MVLDVQRERTDEDCGEIGTGFKSGSVNISGNLTCFTNVNGEYTEMVADWDEMSIENDYTPKILPSERKYSSSSICKHNICNERTQSIQIFP